MSSSTDFKNIQEKINDYNDPSLVHPDESPNGNRIYHLYPDGSITNQKGGWAYLMRSEFTDYGRIDEFPNKMLYFPQQKYVSERYAIMTLEHAIEVREMMMKL